MSKSAFNKLAEQYIVTKNTVNQEVRRQLEAMVAEATDGDDMDKISLKLKAMLKGYREVRTDLTTDAEAVEDISAKINSELSHKLNLSFLYMMQKDGVDMHNSIDEAEALAQQVIDMFPPSLAKEYQDNNKIMWALKLALHNR